MKRITFLFIGFILIGSCRTKQSEKVSNIDTAGLVVRTVTGIARSDSHYFWASELDPKLGLVMKRTVPISVDSLNVTNIIQMLNKQYPEIRLDLIKVSNDSLFVKILKSSYLTQQMGSSGADAYLAEVTYNLTELNGINYVDLRFKEGDHASPGVYSRTDFVRGKD